MTNKLLSLFKSRKFWAALIAAMTTVAGFLMGDVTMWQMIQAIVAIAAAYSTGVAIEDAGFGISGNKPY